MANFDINPLSFWGYRENRDFDALGFGQNITVNPEDKVISIANDVISATVSLDYASGILSLLGIDGAVINSVNLPKSDLLKSASYDAATNELVLVFSTEEGDNEIRISLASLVDTYTAGNGVEINEQKVISIKVNPESVDALELTADGLKFNKNMFATNETVAIVNQNCANSIETLKKNLVDAVNTINGGIDNEIRPVLTANTEAITDLTGQIASEVSRATAAETVLRGAIDNEVSRAKVAEMNLEQKIKEANDTIITVNNNVAESINAINKNMADGFNTINGGINNEIRPYVMSGLTSLPQGASQENILAAIGSFEALREAILAKKVIMDYAGTNLLPCVNYTSANELVANLTFVTSTNAITLYQIQNVGGSLALAVTKREFALSDDIPSVPTTLPNPYALTINYNGVQAFTYDGSAAETGNFTVNAETVPGVESGTTIKDNIVALRTEVEGVSSSIPEALPNPNALTIKYNGVQAFTYDGSKAETGNFIVDATTVPMASDDATTIAQKLSDGIKNPNALTIKYNGVQAFTYDGSAAETGNFIVDATTVPMASGNTTTIATKIAELEARIAALE